MARANTMPRLMSSDATVPAPPACVRTGYVLDPDRADPTSSRAVNAVAMNTASDRHPAGASPVDVAQVQDERELVQHERRGPGEQRGAPDRRPSASAGRDLAHPADDHEHEPNTIGAVRAALCSRCPPPPDLRPDHPDRQPDERRSRPEGHEKQKQRSRPCPRSAG